MMKLIAGSLAALALTAGMAAAQARTDMIVALQLEPPNLDPTAGASGAIDQVVYQNIFEGLTKFEADGSVTPSLAESWEISEDGTVYTFTLRDGVTFHDGSALDAGDVKFTLDRARAEDSTNAQKGLFAGIESVDVVDDLTVAVTLAAPNGNFLFNMAWGDAVIVAEESVGSLATAPVGTGAFRFADRVEGDRVELARYDDYWGEPARLGSATFKFISDPTAAFAAMMAGDIDVFYSYPAKEALPQFESDSRFEVLYGSTEGETILSTNNKMPPLDNVKVREAIAHAIDREAIIEGAQFGVGTPIGTHFAQHNPDYVDLTDLSNYDPDKAKSLLAEAGFGDGFTTTLKLPPPDYARRGGEIIASQLRAVGIETEITNLEWAQWLEEVFRGKDFGLTIVSHTEPFDIGIYANPDYYFQYDNPEFQALMDELGTTTDEATRSEMLAKAQRIIAEDYVNGYLFQLGLASVIKAGVEGIWPDAPLQAVVLTDVGWAE